jgi:hypothetical protein
MSADSFPCPSCASMGAFEITSEAQELSDMDGAVCTQCGHVVTQQEVKDWALKMNGEPSVMFEVQNMETAIQVAQVVIDVRNYYEADRLPQPPFPENATDLAPCTLRVIETAGPSGLRMGKILITNPSGETLFEKEWLVSPGSS